MTDPAPRTWRFARVDLLGTVVVLAAGAAFYWFAVQPIFTLKERYLAQRAQVESQRRDAAHMLARVEELRKSLSAVDAALKQSPVRLEPASNVNARIGQLTDLAAAHGLKIDEMQPAEPTYGKDYGSVPIRLAGNGGYKTWTAFLHQLSTAFPDTSVDSFELTGKPETPNMPVEFRINLVWHVTPQTAALAKTDR